MGIINMFHSLLKNPDNVFFFFFFFFFLLSPYLTEGRMNLPREGIGADGGPLPSPHLDQLM